MNRVIWVGAITLVMGITPLTVGYAETCEAVERYLTWRGDEAYRSLTSLEFEGELATAGLQGSAHLSVRRDGSSRLDYDLGVFSGVEALSPTDAWEKGPSGQVGEMGAGDAAALRRSLDEIYSLSIQGQGKGQVSCLKVEKKEGASYDVIRVSFADGNFFDYFVAPEDGALGWVREKRDDEVSWIEYGDWKSVAGVKLAHRIHNYEENPTNNSTLRWKTITLNPDLSSDIFEQPKDQGSLLTFADGANSSGWINFEFFRQRRIFIDGLVNGHPASIILDSGAEMTVLDSAFAKTLGLDGQGDIAADGVVGSTTVSLAKDVTVEIGNLKASGLTVVIIDLSEIAKAVGHPIPVIFGEEVFNELVVDVDYPRERISFNRPEFFSTEGLSKPLDIVSVSGGQKEIEISVNGLPPVPVGLDTGSADTISFFKPWTDAHGLLEGLQTSTRMTGGVGGDAIALIGTVDSIQIGDTVLKEVPVSFSRTEKGGFATAELGGNMGVQIFRQFRTTFDFGRNLLYLTPPNNFRPSYDRNRTGLGTNKEGNTLVVVHVAEGSPAQKAGFKVGDRIEAIDQVAIGEGYWEELYGWSMNPVGTALVFDLVGGRTIEVLLADYY